MISSIQSFLEQFLKKSYLLLPEACIALGIVILLVLGFFKLKNLLLIFLYVFILIGALAISFFLTDEAIFLPFRRLVLLTALGSLIFFIGSPLFRSENTTESLFLLLASTLGLNMMMLAEDLLSLFVALELAAISFYILVILAWKPNSTEGAMKYLLFGVFASALMLYGISWVYGLAGTIDLKPLSWKFSLGFLQYMALFLMLAGLLMKISAVPYHIWTPDAYQIAPTPVVAFLITASKIAGIVAILKIVKAYEPIFPNITQIIAWIAIISIILGNLVAFWQKNLKRMLAYSSIANAGYLLIGAVQTNTQNALFFFLLVYSLANMLVLAIAEYYEQKYQYTDLEHFSGLGKASPAIAVALLIGFISLVGLPPTAGFTAKLFIFSTLWEKFEITKQTTLLIWLFVGLLNTIVALFYYLKVPYFAFFRNPKDAQASKFPAFLLIGTSLLAALLIWFFIQPF